MGFLDGVEVGFLVVGWGMGFFTLGAVVGFLMGALRGFLAGVMGFGFVETFFWAVGRGFLVPMGWTTILVDRWM